MDPPTLFPHTAFIATSVRYVSPAQQSPPKGWGRGCTRVDVHCYVFRVTCLLIQAIARAQWWGVAFSLRFSNGGQGAGQTMPCGGINSTGDITASRRDKGQNPLA